MGLLPNVPLFSHLYKDYKQDPHAIIIRDASLGVTVTREQFLRDVLGLRNDLFHVWGDGIAEKIQADQDGAFVAILLPAGYDFWVAFMAVQAMGAVAVPICKLLIHIPTSLQHGHKPDENSRDGPADRGQILHEIMQRHDNDYNPCTYRHCV